MSTSTFAIATLAAVALVPLTMAGDKAGPELQDKPFAKAPQSNRATVERFMPSDGVILMAANTIATQGGTAAVQIRATTTDLIGGFGFNAEPVGFGVSTVRYDGPIFATSWQGWDTAPSADVRVDAACIFTKDQVAPGDHRLVTLEVAIPENLPAGTVIPVLLTNVQFFNYDFSVPTLLPQDGSIIVTKTSDLDGNGEVGPEDLGKLLASWGPADENTPGDLNGDLVVDGFDLGRMLDRWGDEG